MGQGGGSCIACEGCGRGVLGLAAGWVGGLGFVVAAGDTFVTYVFFFLFFFSIRKKQRVVVDRDAPFRCIHTPISILTPTHPPLD